MKGESEIQCICRGEQPVDDVLVGDPVGHGRKAILIGVLLGLQDHGAVSPGIGIGGTKLASRRERPPGRRDPRTGLIPVSASYSTSANE